MMFYGISFYVTSTATGSAKKLQKVKETRQCQYLVVQPVMFSGVVYDL